MYDITKNLEELVALAKIRVEDSIKYFFPLVKHDGDWFPPDEDYNYDWYCPVGAPPSQQMWCEYLNWASNNLEMILHQGYYRQMYFAELPYPTWIPWRHDNDRNEYNRMMLEIASYKEDEV